MPLVGPTVPYHPDYQWVLSLQLIQPFQEFPVSLDYLADLQDLLRLDRPLDQVHPFYQWLQRLQYLLHLLAGL